MRNNLRQRERLPRQWNGQLTAEGPLPSRAPTWELLRRHIEDRIASGVYPVGAWLPSVRELAIELNVNRNTVSKAYQALGRTGIVEVAPGRGVHVVARPTSGVTDAAESRIGEALTAVVTEASILGLDRDWLLKSVQSTADEIYGTRRLRVAFVECTPPDTQQVAEQLSGHLSLQVKPLDLVEFTRDPTIAAESFDLLTTTYFHLQEVASVLPARSPELVGIHHAVSHESVLQIARLRPGSTIVVVSPNERSLDRMSRIVQDYARGQLYRVIPGADSKLAQALALADVVVDMSSTHELVRAMDPEVPTITVTFQIEPTSLDYLRHAVRRLSREIVNHEVAV